MTHDDTTLTTAEERLTKLMRIGGTQKKIAKRLRVTPGFFNQWLKNKRNSPRLVREFEKLYTQKMKNQQ